MEYRTFKQTDLKVSRLCFGTMTFGKPADQPTATRMVDLCLDRGINFLDTANIYQLGQAEEMLGHAIRGRRDRLIIASKVRGKMGDGPDEVGLSRRAIARAIEESLRRLETDYLDLYYLHQPDYDTSIDETLEALERLVTEGKVRYPATSNYSSWQVCQMLSLARERDYRPAVIAQPMYNLVARGIEQEFLPMARELGVGIVVYNPLAGGLLTGKHTQASVPPGRFHGNQMYMSRFWRPEYFRAVEQLKQIAEKAGRSLIGLAFGWLLHHTATDCVILGASRVEQLEQNLAACDEGPLSADTVRACDEIWNELRGPTPIYNR